MRKLFALILLILIFWLQYRIWFGVSSQQKIEQLKLQISEQKKQVEQIKSLNQDLQHESILLRNNPDILEEKARENMGMIKKEEIFYRIIREPKKNDKKK